MDPSTLALQFNEVSDQLQARGHRVIVRRLRAFLEAGDVRGAEGFLQRAKESLGNNDAGVGQLAGALGGFTAAGGEVARLITEPAWVEGAAKERRLGKLVEAAASQPGLGGLVDQLARQQRALASGEPLAAAPSRQVSPSALPPLPKAPTATGAALDEARAPLGSIFKPKASRAVVEVESDLEARSLDLDDNAVETPDLPADAPEIPVVEERPAARVAQPIDTPSLEPMSAPETPLPTPEPLVKSGPASRTASPMVLPELHAPPEMPTAPVGGSQDKGGKGLLVAIILAALGLIGAGAFFALK